MRRILLFAFVYILASLNAHAALRGSWNASLREDGRLQFNMRRDHSNNGHGYNISEFRGLNVNANGPTTFELVRDAGTFKFDGVFSDGEGAGHFTFTPNSSYVSTLRGLGVSAEELDEESLFSLASLDVSSDFIREMQSLGYKVSLDKYTTFRIHGVSPQFVRDVRALGYDPSADKLVTFRIHGVTPDFIRAMRDAGYKVSADQLVTFRIHGVSSEFVRNMRELGYTNVEADELVTFRIHGVTPEFVRALADLGYRNVDADDLVAMRIHGVTPEYIRSLRDAGYSNIPVDKLVSMRIHGIDADMVRKLK